MQESIVITLLPIIGLAIFWMVVAGGIIVMNRDNKNELIAARKGSPVVIGIGKDEYFISSDASSIIEHTKNFIGNHQ